MDITNQTILNSLNKFLLESENDTNVNAHIQTSMQIIENGILTWSQQFELKHGRKPTYSDMRAEFG